MLLKHHSGAPSDHVIKYVRGKPVMEGRGLDFLYAPYFTKIVSVPTCPVDTRFALNGRTSDYQRVRIVGEVVFRITAPKRAAAHIDFTIKHGRSRSASSCASILRRRVLSIVRSIVADEIGRMSVRKAVVASYELGRSVKVRASHSRQLIDMGVSVIGVHVRDIECSAELAEELEAEHLSLPLLAGQPSGDASMMSSSWRQTSKVRGEAAAPAGPSIECTDSCPFRHVCEDHMKDIRGGKAWCTLFREFSI